MSKYSEGSWGLSVQVRVAGIFTGTAISPSPGRRQCRSRYTIRAGRNLPDKEFRYLRTVIVTAAVYRGFDSGLRLRCPLLLTFRHRARVRPYTSTCVLAWPCVFGKQSLLPFPCDLQRLRTVHTDPRRLPLSRSYGVDLPSSFSRVVSSTLGYSPRPPVSVYGTGLRSLP